MQQRQSIEPPTKTILPHAKRLPAAAFLNVPNKLPPHPVGEDHRHGGAFTQAAVYRQAGFVVFGGMFHDGQAQACAPRLLGAAFVGAVETLEDLVLLVACKKYSGLKKILRPLFVPDNGLLQ